MIANQIKPGGLLALESDACFGFFHEPFIEAFLGRFRKGFYFRPLLGKKCGINSFILPSAASLSIFSLPHVQRVSLALFSRLRHQIIPVFFCLRRC